MDIVKIVEEKMGQNTYVIIEEETKTAVVIDAGAPIELIEEHLNMFTVRPTVKAVLLTHAHFDHIRNLDEYIKSYDCKAYICSSGKENLYDKDKNLSYLDENPFVIKNKKNIVSFADGDVLTFGNLDFICYNTPGHSADSSCFAITDNLFTGDTIFKVGVGRTDMFSGNEDVLRISLTRLRDEISQDVNHFYAGHGANFDKDDFEYNVNRAIGEE
jgi:glyoxylase-like metal-dependent hydrolase (beta-lactamase superfamily II)